MTVEEKSTIKETIEQELKKLEEQIYQYQTIIHHNSNAKTVQLLGKKL